MTPRLATACLSLSFLVGLGLLTGCGGSGSNTDCDLGGCTITFARSGGTSVSVLGIEAKLVGVENGQAKLSVAGHEVNVPVGGETQSEGFTVRVERLTDTEVVVRVTH